MYCSYNSFQDYIESGVAMRGILLILSLFAGFLVSGCSLEKVDADQLFALGVTKVHEGNDYYLVVDIKPNDVPKGYKSLTGIELSGVTTGVSYEMKVQNYSDVHTPESWNQQGTLELPLGLVVDQTITILFKAEHDDLFNAETIQFTFDGASYEYSLVD
jgi:hypothetical protein